jgi:hypothetical protein
MLELMEASAKTAAVFALPAPAVEEPPDDVEDEDGTYAPEALKPKQAAPVKDPEHEELKKEIFGEEKPSEEKKSESPAYAKATGKPVEPPKEASKAPVKTPRDPATIKNAGNLVNACVADFNMTAKEVYKELGINSINDLTIKPADAFATIQKSREGKKTDNGVT